MKEIMKKKEIIRTLIFVTGIILITAYLSGCQQAEEAPTEIPANAIVGDIIDLKPCTYEAKDIEYSAECGELIVQENRVDPDSRLIAIPITRIYSTSGHPAEPIFYLSGGPGGSNTRFFGGRIAWFIEQHEIVLVGYRCVDGTVRLDCPEVSAHIKNLPGDMLGVASIEQMTTAYASCAERFQNEGVDVAGYTPVEVIDDF